MGGPRADAGDGDRIDECRLARNGALYCSTPNRRNAAALKAVLDTVSGFDRDEREEEVMNIVQHWKARQKGPCRDAAISVRSDVMNAYSYPGLSTGEHIDELEGCTKQFALWLFKQENHGLPPGDVAWANTVMLQDREDVKTVKGCAGEVKALLGAGKAWLDAEKLFAKVKAKNLYPPPDADKTAEEAAQEKRRAREVAVRRLNACLDGEPTSPPPSQKTEVGDDPAWYLR